MTKLWNSWAEDRKLGKKMKQLYPISMADPLFLGQIDLGVDLFGGRV